MKERRVDSQPYVILSWTGERKYIYLSCSSHVVYFLLYVLLSTWSDGQSVWRSRCFRRTHEMSEREDLTIYPKDNVITLSASHSLVSFSRGRWVDPWTWEMIDRDDRESGRVTTTGGTIQFGNQDTSLIHVTRSTWWCFSCFYWFRVTVIAHAFNH